MKSLILLLAVWCWLGLFQARGQSDIEPSAVSWYQSDEILSFTQLDTAQFVDSLERGLRPKTYYYIKVQTPEYQSDSLNFLLSDVFTDVSFILSDSLAHVKDLGWDIHKYPLIIEIPKHQMQAPYFYLRCLNYSYGTYPRIGVYWMSETYYSDKYKTPSNDLVIKDALPNILTTGIILTFIIFFFALYISNTTQKVYLHYVLYLLPLGIYLFMRSSYAPYYLFPQWTADYPYLLVVTNLPVQVMFHIAYIVFTFSFLEAKDHYKLYYKVGRIIVIIGLVYLVILTVGMYFQPFHPLLGDSFRIERLIISLFGLWANVYVIINRKDRMALIVPIGALIFMLGAWGSFFFHMNAMRLGSVVEVIFFSLGIGYKLKLERQEKDNIKTKLIHQLQETDKLQKRYNEELEVEVKARSDELVEKTKQVEEEKKMKMKAQLENKVEEMRMVAMRSQMNPHFLFNSLNSIRNLIIKQKTTSAYDYLSEFSVLMRSVLENAEKDAIPLHLELRVIETYISLEKLRFDEDFTFKIVVDEQLEAESVLVPPLIIQPFLENAIIHGLAPKTSDKTLVLDIKQDNRYLIIKIEDNGVGIKAGSKNGKHRKNKPMAIKIAKERLDLFANHHIKTSVQPSISIQDNKDLSTPATGTTVLIELPMVYDA
ncbi:MAG: histidine kinase [Bacteroidota bacterium]